MGWNWHMTPDSSRAYQTRPATEAKALKEDLILWPPIIVVHNSSIGAKNKIITIKRMEEILKGLFVLWKLLTSNFFFNHLIDVHLEVFLGLWAVSKENYLMNVYGLSKFFYITTCKLFCFWLFFTYVLLLHFFPRKVNFVFSFCCYSIYFHVKTMIEKLCT